MDFVVHAQVTPTHPYHWNVFSSSHGLKIGSVVGYSVLALFLLSVPSSFRSGYVANMMGS